jgi:hypothetical protein
MSVSLVRKLIFSLVLALQLSTSGVLQAQTLKVPYVSLSPTAGPLWIAYEAGYFKKIMSVPSYSTSRADRRSFKRSSPAMSE